MLRKPYLLFLGTARSLTEAKTACGLRNWCPADDIVGETSLPGATITLGLPGLSLAEAGASGAGSLVIGVAPVGGRIPAEWHVALLDAVDAGLDIVSGMHDRLSNVPGLAERAAARGVSLHDVRHHAGRLEAATGDPRPGLRLLTVGTDCALGKKYTALALTRALQAAGAKASFRATGQTGIMISGGGIAVDAVVADFVAGAAEQLSPANDPDHWDIIEGQGALFHPAYAGVSLGLLHGSQPDAIILCHDPERTNVTFYPRFPLPSIKEAIDAYLAAGRLTNPRIACHGISLNTSGMGDRERSVLMEDLADLHQVPVFDPLRDPLDAVVAPLLAMARRAA